MNGHLSPGYGVLVVTGGNGQLSTETGSSVLISRGSTVLIPHAAGACRLAGDVQAVRCLPAA